jgi:hypothetical protein
MAQEPGELDGEGNPELGFDGPGTVCDRHGLGVEARFLRHLRMKGCPGGQKTAPELVCLGAREAGS